MESSFEMTVLTVYESLLKALRSHLRRTLEDFQRVRTPQEYMISYENGAEQMIQCIEYAKRCLEDKMRMDRMEKNQLAMDDSSMDREIEARRKIEIGNSWRSKKDSEYS